MTPEMTAEAMTHEHRFLGSGHDENARRMLWVVALTAAMMVAEIVFGAVFNSMALLADGFHMATHAGALGVAAAAYAFARRHESDPHFTFGTGKVGDLAGFASALVLALVAAGIAVESAIRLFQPQPVAFGEATLIAIVGLGVNVVSALLLGHGHDHGHGGDGHACSKAHGHDHPHVHAHDHHHHESAARHSGTKRGDNNFRSAYLHVIADALTSVLAIAALLGGRYLGWVWLDPLMGIVGAVVIASWSWTLLRDTAAVLLDASDLKIAREIRECVEGPGDATITDLHIWRVGPEADAAIVSVVGIDGQTVRRRLAPVHEIAHLTVETA